MAVAVTDIFTSLAQLLGRENRNRRGEVLVVLDNIPENMGSVDENVNHMENGNRTTSSGTTERTKALSDLNMQIVSSNNF